MNAILKISREQFVKNLANNWVGEESFQEKFDRVRKEFTDAHVHEEISAEHPRCTSPSNHPGTLDMNECEYK